MFGTAQKRISSWDIGSNSIKILLTEGVDPQGNIKLVQSLEVKNSLGFVVPEENIQIEQMMSLIGSILNEYNLPHRGIRLSLPENAVSTQVIELPPLSPAELSSSIRWQAEQYLPIPNDELVTEYQVLYEPDKNDMTQANNNMRVLLVGTRRRVIDNLVSVFRGNGAEPVLMETQTISLLRQFSIQPEEPSTLLVNIGKETCTIVAVRKGEPVFVVVNPEAGDLLTKALVNAFNLPKDQAELYKATYGLLPNEGEGKVLQGLKPIADLIVNNVRSAMNFFSTKTEQARVERVILTGGSAQLPGLSDYLRAAVGVEVGLADNMNGFGGVLPEKNQLSYSVAAGLAKRSS